MFENISPKRMRMTRIFVDKMVNNGKKIQEDVKSHGVMKYYGTGTAGSRHIQISASS